MLTVKDKIILEVILPLMLDDLDSNGTLRPLLKANFDDIEHITNPKNVDESHHPVLLNLSVAFEMRQIDMATYQFYANAVYKLKQGGSVALDKVLQFAEKTRFQKDTNPLLRPIIADLISQKDSPFDFVQKIRDLMIHKNWRGDVEPVIQKAMKKALGIKDDLKEGFYASINEDYNGFSSEYDYDIHKTKQDISVIKVLNMPLDKFEKYLNGSKVDIYSPLTFSIISSKALERGQRTIADYAQIVDRFAKQNNENPLKSLSKNEGSGVGLKIQKDVLMGDFKQLKSLLSHIEKGSFKNGWLENILFNFLKKMVLTPDLINDRKLERERPNLEKMIEVFNDYKSWETVIRNYTSGLPEKNDIIGLVNFIKSYNKK